MSSRSYISYRQSYSHHPSKRARFTDSHSVFAGDDDRRGLLSAVDDDDASHNGDTVIEMDHLPPRWADVSDEVSELLQGIARKSTLLERLHNKHVLPGFDDSRSEEGEIERLTTEITNDFRKCQDKIQRVGSMVEDTDCSKAEEVMGRNIQVSLATRVQESSTQFRKKQSAYLKSTPPGSWREHTLTPDRAPWTIGHDNAAGPHGIAVALQRRYGSERGCFVLAVSAAAVCNTHLQRCSDNAARTRDHGYCEGDYRVGRYL